MRTTEVKSDAVSKEIVALAESEEGASTNREQTIADTFADELVATVKMLRRSGRAKAFGAEARAHVMTIMAVLEEMYERAEKTAAPRPH